ncbi:MAG TPA: HEAT repeat domain-containing protein [Gemmataceae bacterium]|nr:HEAT repeat domain-containing protein [Gemmataceae bacterium]
MTLASTGRAEPEIPRIAPASNEGQRETKRIQAPSGMQVDLWAAEPMFANPVCFAIDEHNRIYVAETFRLHRGVTDIRGHMNWLIEDLACRTVADREAIHRRHESKARLREWEQASERVTLLEDTHGSGKADKATTFATGFHHLADGLGAGLLAHKDYVWFTCIPDLYLLHCNQSTAQADQVRSLQTGYGVHISFIGHDLHGLRLGPDGKLYFSIGDRGLNVVKDGRRVESVDCGAVLRCSPDGTDLEIVATGLRNPQELVFDQYGNLFTGDNNADHGDKARWVYVVDGGDSGWRIGYQSMTWPVALGPWNAERLWLPQWDGQAAYIVPPIANVCDGPSGVTYNPGTSQLPARYREHFFLCDFRGGSGGQSGVRAFAVKPKGASFEMVDQHECVWSVLATDVDFGTDGALYVSDWVDGWDMPGKGRIFKIHDPARANDPLVLEVKRLLAEGMDQRPLAELTRLLEHPDMRVRQAAQFAIVDRSSGWPWPGTGREVVRAISVPQAIAAFTAVAQHNSHPLARLHAIWGLGQIGRKDTSALTPLLALLADRDAEVRAQAAKLLGEDRQTEAFERLLPLLKDSSTRVRFFAALALGRLGRAEAVTPVLEMLRDNDDKDPYLRHAGVMALARIHDREQLSRAASNDSPAVRMAVLLAWRRLHDPQIARFLNDVDTRLVVEAARAINDVAIPGALPKLATLTGRPDLPDPLMRRVLNANFRLGQPKNAVALATFAARADAPEALRVEALRELSQWTKPSPRDRLTGLYRPLAPRSAQPAADAVRSVLGGIFGGSDRVREEGARVAARLGIKEVGPVLFALAGDSKRPSRVRVQALAALDTLRDPRLEQAMTLAMADRDDRVRTEGRRILARLQPDEAVSTLAKALYEGNLADEQGALQILRDMHGPKVEALLGLWLDRLLAGKVPLALQLDLLEAAQAHSTDALRAKLARYEALRPKNDPLAPFRETLAGGDAEAGRRIFFTKAAVSCTRCHKINGSGGEVGPDLSKIGAQHPRDYLLESIVLPNKQIAKGFDTVVLSLTNGKVVSGVLKSEDAREIRLMNPDGKLLIVPKNLVDERTTGKSAMPDDVMKYLNKHELRDLIEYLAELK